MASLRQNKGISINQGCTTALLETILLVAGGLWV
jgi:hypothetical protein